jgi:hypothetical protein
MKQNSRGHENYEKLAVKHMGFKGWSKNRTEKNRTGNVDTFLDITFLYKKVRKKCWHRLNRLIVI